MRARKLTDGTPAILTRRFRGRRAGEQVFVRRAGAGFAGDQAEVITEDGTCQKIPERLLRTVGCECDSWWHRR